MLYQDKVQQTFKMYLHRLLQVVIILTKVLDIILTEYPEYQNYIFDNTNDEANSVLEAITLAKFPGVRIDLVIMEDYDT